MKINVRIIGIRRIVCKRNICRVYEMVTSRDRIDASNRERAGYRFRLHPSISECIGHGRMNTGRLINFMELKKNTNTFAQLLHRCIYRVPIVRRRYLFLTGSPQLFSQPIQEQVIRTCTFPLSPPLLSIYHQRVQRKLM